MNARFLPLAILVVGGVMIAAAQHWPEFYDPNWEQPFHQSAWENKLDAAFTLATKGDSKAYDLVADEWFTAREKAMTPRDILMDLGTGIAILGLSLAALFTKKQIRQLSDLATITTPRTRLRFYGLAILSWLGILPSAILRLFYSANRGDFPWFGDVIAIPIASTGILVMIGLPFILLGVGMTTSGTDLPRRLWSAPIIGHRRLLVIILMLGLLFDVYQTGWALRYSPTLVAPGVFIAYLLLSSRAAAVTERGAVVTR